MRVHPPARAGIRPSSAAGDPLSFGPRTARKPPYRISCKPSDAHVSHAVDGLVYPHPHPHPPTHKLWLYVCDIRARCVRREGNETGDRYICFRVVVVPPPPPPHLRAHPRPRPRPFPAALPRVGNRIAQCRGVWAGGLQRPAWLACSQLTEGIRGWGEHATPGAACASWASWKRPRQPPITPMNQFLFLGGGLGPDII